MGMEKEEEIIYPENAYKGKLLTIHCMKLVFKPLSCITTTALLNCLSERLLFCLRNFTLPELRAGLDGLGT